MARRCYEFFLFAVCFSNRHYDKLWSKYKNKKHNTYTYAWTFDKWKCSFLNIIYHITSKHKYSNCTFFFFIYAISVTIVKSIKFACLICLIIYCQSLIFRNIRYVININGFGVIIFIKYYIEISCIGFHWFFIKNINVYRWNKMVRFGDHLAVCISDTCIHNKSLHNYYNCHWKNYKLYS